MTLGRQAVYLIKPRYTLVSAGHSTGNRASPLHPLFIAARPEPNHNLALRPHWGVKRHYIMCALHHALFRGYTVQSRNCAHHTVHTMHTHTTHLHIFHAVHYEFCKCCSLAGKAGSYPGPKNCSNWLCVCVCVCVCECVSAHVCALHCRKELCTLQIVHPTLCTTSCSCVEIYFSPFPAPLLGPKCTMSEAS